MENLKIAIIQKGIDAATGDLLHRLCEDPAMLELCTPIIYGQEEKALRDLDEGEVKALVIVHSVEPAKRPSDATEIIVTEEAYFMPFTKEPTAEDIIRLRDILERDFNIRSPRIAIVQESNIQNQELASQVTTEQGINTYGPYTQEQILAEDMICHYDGIIVAEGETMMQHIITALSLKAPVRYYAGRKSVVTAPYRPVHIEDAGDGLADVSELTHPIYTAVDIVHNRTFYDEARQDILPKLFRDKREDRRQGEAPQANTNNDNTEKES